MQIKRIFRHFFYPHFRSGHFFPEKSLLAIEAAIGAIESVHQGEIVFAVEASLELRDLLRGLSARERAVQMFSNLRVWDTECNNGVLLYLLLADKDIEIVADRGVAARVAPEIWRMICGKIEWYFKSRRFEEGIIAGIDLIGRQLAEHYPAAAPASGELPDKPVVL